MKKLMTFFSIGLISLITLGSCGTSKKTTSEEPSSSMGQTSKDYDIFTQNHVANAGLTDPDIMDSLDFYNSAGVDMSATTPNRKKKFENGGLILTSGSQSKVREIPTRTLGHVVKIQRSANKSTVDYLWVKFDTEDEVFKVCFARNPTTGEYRLYNDGSKAYSLNVNGSNCVLLFSVKTETFNESDVKKAKGHMRGATTSTQDNPGTVNGLPPIQN